ncbi:STARP antigen [Elysia marginata]|uniref:STARP antigen n=1 Tax=Elysia marginata TaxID=1093978 RepID=A0AAV4H3X1_9GAST|nr:STARP antigen [Elysia marginata]
MPDDLVLRESRSGGTAGHIESTRDVIAVAHALTQGSDHFSRGCSLLYPVHRLGTEYVAVTECSTYHCFILVVAARKQAFVTVDLRLNIPRGVAVDNTNHRLNLVYNGQPYHHGEKIEQILAVGEFMQILAQEVDLSGSRVTSNVPVAVISGGDFTTMRETSAAEFDPQGMILDQTPPLEDLGYVHRLISPRGTRDDALVKVVYTEVDTHRNYPPFLEEPFSVPETMDNQGRAKTDEYEYLKLAAGSAMTLAYSKPVLVMVMFPSSARMYKNIYDNAVAGVILTPERRWAHSYPIPMSKKETTLVLVSIKSSETSQAMCNNQEFYVGMETVELSWFISNDESFYFSFLESKYFDTFENVSSPCIFGGYLLYKTPGRFCACALGWQRREDGENATANDQIDKLRFTTEKASKLGHIVTTESILQQMRTDGNEGQEQKLPTSTNSLNGNTEDDENTESYVALVLGRTVFPSILTTDRSVYDSPTKSQKDHNILLTDRSVHDSPTDRSDLDTQTTDRSNLDTQTPDRSNLDTQTTDRSDLDTQTTDSSNLDTQTTDRSDLDTQTTDRSDLDTQTTDRSDLDTQKTDRNVHDSSTNPQKDPEQQNDLSSGSHSVEEETTSFHYFTRQKETHTTSGMKRGEELFELSTKHFDVSRSTKSTNVSLLCPCQCQAKGRLHELSKNRLKLEAALDEQIQMLKVKHSSLSKQRRRHTSAVNSEDSAWGIGATITTCAVVVVVVFLVLGDLCTLLARLKTTSPQAQLSRE